MVMIKNNKNNSNNNNNNRMVVIHPKKKNKSPGRKAAQSLKVLRSWLNLRENQRKNDFKKSEFKYSTVEREYLGALLSYFNLKMHYSLCVLSVLRVLKQIICHFWVSFQQNIEKNQPINHVFLFEFTLLRWAMLNISTTDESEDTLTLKTVCLTSELSDNSKCLLSILSWQQPEINIFKNKPPNKGEDLYLLKRAIHWVSLM